MLITNPIPNTTICNTVVSKLWTESEHVFTCAIRSYTEYGFSEFGALSPCCQSSCHTKNDSQPFRSRANSLPGANRPTAPWPIRSLKLSLPGAKWPGNLLLRKYIATYTHRESSRERNGQGAKAPGNELAGVLLVDSLLGATWPGSEKARYPKNHEFTNSS